MEADDGHPRSAERNRESVTQIPPDGPDRSRRASGRFDAA